MSFVLDSNIIIYAFDQADIAKHRIASLLLDASLTSGRFTLRQILGEVLNAAHKKRHLSVTDARQTVADIANLVDVHGTPDGALLPASKLAERFKLQFFDALICTLSRDHGAVTLFSEDMHNGLDIGGLIIVNPFLTGNAAVVADALA